jgi:hypothetical protein
MPKLNAAWTGTLAATLLILLMLGPLVTRAMPLACAEIEPLLQTELTCVAQRPLVESHHARCIAGRSMQPFQTASLHALMIEVFDREQTLMFRRYPLEPARSTWQSFQEKWRRRVEANPAVLSHEQSESLKAEFRGGLARRIRVVPGTYRKALEAEAAMRQSLGASRPGSFYWLTASLLLRVLEQPATRDLYLRQLEKEGLDGPQRRSRADEVLNDQRNLLLLMYPEIELQDGSNLIVNSFLLGHRLQIDAVTELANALDFDGAVLPIQDRFLRLARAVDLWIKQSPHGADFSVNLEAAFTALHERTIQELDRAVDQALAGRSSAHELSWVLNRALVMLEPGQSLLRQSLQTQQCVRVYDDVFWQKIHDFNQSYISPVLDASLAVVVLGAGSAGLGIAGVRYLAGRAFGLALSRHLIAGGLMGVRAGGAVLWVGLPASMESFRYALLREWQAHERFYQVAHLSEFISGTQLAPLRTATRWESLNLFLNVAPLAFIRF